MRDPRRTVLLSLVLIAVVPLPLLPIGDSILRSWRPDSDLGPPGDGWRLALIDSFRSEELGDVWATCYWWNAIGCSNRGNAELQWYIAEQSRPTRGRLPLTAIDDAIVNDDGERWAYRSGMVTTGPPTREDEPGFAFTYGHVEVDATVPSGTGLWPALWLLPTTLESRPEIDFMEVLGDSTDLLRLHVHYVDGDGERQSLGHDVETDDLSETAHTYGLTWTATELTFWLDGEEVWTVDEADAIPHEPMYLLANLAVGGEWPGPPDDATRFPATFEIDEVRIWQRAP